MRTMVLVSMALLLAGCGADVLVTTAVTADMQAQQLKAMRGQVQQASGKLGRVNIECAISMYQADKGSFPPSLDALAPTYLPAVPTKPDGSAYGYDPATGRLSDTPAPANGPTAEDLKTMEAIRAAINQFGTEVGYYPGTLDALVPKYLAAAPRTASGEAFLYNNQNGQVTHPRQGQATAAATQSRPATAGVGGAGPMGEVMTSVGVQQQLNGMSQSGSSAVGGYARDHIQQNTNSYGEQQNKAMDNLGL
jgi:hypothetical protein